MIYVILIFIIAVIGVGIFIMTRGELYMNMGYKLEKEGRLNDAIKWYENSVNANTEDHEVRLRLARLYKKVGLSEKAINQFQAVIAGKRYPEYTSEQEIRLELGETFESIESLNNAFVEYHKVIQSNPLNVAAHKRIGAIYAGQGILDKAIKHYNKALEINPKDKDIHFYLGLSYIDMNRTHDAMRSLENAVKSSPDNLKANYYLGVIYKDRNMLDQAIKLFNTTANQSNDSNIKMESHRLLGETYKELGLIDEAITNYEEAVKKTVDNNDIEKQKEILYNLGMAYTKSGKKQLAINNWEKLQSIDNSYKDVNELIRTGKESFHMSDFDAALMNWEKAKSEETKYIKGRGLMKAKTQFNLEELEKQLGNGGIGSFLDSSSSNKYERFLSTSMKQFVSISHTLLRKMGFNVLKDVHNPNDVNYIEGKGVDFIAQSDIKGKRREMYYIQIRRWHELVGEIPLRNCIENMIKFGCEKALFIVTSEFTSQAISIAKREERLSLIDGSGLNRALRKIIN